LDTTNNKHCWVFFSKVQQRLKCRTQHPNNPSKCFPCFHLVLTNSMVAHRCHAKSVALWTEENLDSTWKPKKPNTSNVQEESKFLLSHRAISLVLPDSVKKQLQNETRQSSPVEYKPEPHLLPPTCSCNLSWKHSDEQFAIGKYHTVGFVKKVIVYCRKCVANKCVWHFDGQEAGVMNYSGETLVSYTLLNEFYNRCVRNGMSWSGFLNKTNFMYKDVYSLEDDIQQSMSSNTFSKVLAGLVNSAVITTQKHFPTLFSGCFSLFKAHI
jgi:hypothetical protein